MVIHRYLYILLSGLLRFLVSIFTHYSGQEYQWLALFSVGFLPIVLSGTVLHTGKVADRIQQIGEWIETD